MSERRAEYHVAVDAMIEKAKQLNGIFGPGVRFGLTVTIGVYGDNVGLITAMERALEEADGAMLLVDVVELAEWDKLPEPVAQSGGEEPKAPKKRGKGKSKVAAVVKVAEVAVVEEKPAVRVEVAETVARVEAAGDAVAGTRRQVGHGGNQRKTVRAPRPVLTQQVFRVGVMVMSGNALRARLRDKAITPGSQVERDGKFWAVNREYKLRYLGMPE